MRITLNGEPRETAAMTLDALVAAEALEATVVATAVNGEFVPRRERPKTTIRDGDTVEIFSPRQGG